MRRREPRTLEMVYGAGVGRNDDFSVVIILRRQEIGRKRADDACTYVFFAQYFHHYTRKRQSVAPAILNYKMPTVLMR